MSAGVICKHNQTGYCKYKFSCRKTHENKLCPEEDKCTSTNVCSYTPKRANTSSETEFAGMEKDALMRIKESVMKIRKFKK